MIELPEAVTLARQVSAQLTGRRVVEAAANSSPHKFAWYTGDPAAYASTLPGATIRSSEAFGNHVEIQCDSLTLVISTPMRWHNPGEPLPEKHQLCLRFDDGSALTCTVQMWGVMLAVPHPTSPKFLKEGIWGRQEGAGADYALAKKKPSPLSDAFDRAYFASLLTPETAALSAKAFLATEQRIPGLGNGVLQDILWTARVHPKQKMGTKIETQYLASLLYHAVRDVLKSMTELGGRDTERDLFGQPGAYRTVLSKNTVEQPCPRCGASIRKEPYLGGAIYYCPTCQELG